MKPNLLKKRYIPENRGVCGAWRRQGRAAIKGGEARGKGERASSHGNVMRRCAGEVFPPTKCRIKLPRNCEWYYFLRWYWQYSEYMKKRMCRPGWSDFRSWAFNYQRKFTIRNFELGIRNYSSWHSLCLGALAGDLRFSCQGLGASFLTSLVCRLPCGRISLGVLNSELENGDWIE